LPTPASPATTTATGVPAAARSVADRSRASSVARRPGQGWRCAGPHRRSCPDAAGRDRPLSPGHARSCAVLRR
jgi:hypothetical protein